jgi:type IX secretion system PorP/SprF family membrane protein
MLKKIIFASLIVAAGCSYAQQIPQYSQYMRNPYLLNPGAAGVYDFVDVTMGGRWQWAGFSNAPMTGYLAITSPLTKKQKPRFNPSIRTSDGIPRNPEINTGKLKHAVGGVIVADQYGAFRNLSINGTYALHLPVSKNLNLSFGTRVGLSNNAFMPDRAQVLSGTIDNSYQQFNANGSSRYIMNIGAGLYLYSKRLFVGIASDHLAKDFVSFGSGTMNFDSKMHFNFMAGYKFNLNEEWTLTPAAVAKFMRPAPLSIEGTLMAEYKEFLWFGASYRHTDAIIGMLGLNISNVFKIGYSFDYSLNPFSQYSSGGHEFILGLMLGRNK